MDAKELEVTDEMVQRAAAVAQERVVPYDAWWYDTPEDLARAMLKAALENREH